MSWPVICKFSAGLTAMKMTQQAWMSSDNSCSKYHQTTTSGNCHHLKKVYNFILKGVANNLVGYGETQQAKNKYRQSKVLAGLYKRKTCLYIGQNCRDNQF